MAIWAANYTRGSVASNSKINLVQENQNFLWPVSRSSLEIKLFSYGDGVSFPDGLSQLRSRSVSVFSNPLGVPVNYDAAIEIFWFDEDSSYRISTNSYGNFNPVIYNVFQPLAVTSLGTFKLAVLISNNLSQTAINSFSDIYVTFSRRNWVKWSNIGSVDFTIDISNIAGERPMDWSGLVYKIKKLDKKIIVYGENGVSILTPYDNNYGLTTILNQGILSRNAVVGTEFIHFFIDVLGHLYQFSDKLEKLGYEEFLKDLNNPVLSYDPLIKLLYICDGTSGYVYSNEEKSLGVGPNNITGIGYKDNSYYIASYNSITIPNFEIWTDIIDFGTRKVKTLHSIEIGTDLEKELLVAIEFRMQKNANFYRLPWIRTNPEGIAFFICHGIEFRIGAKVNSYEYFEIDYIDIEGRIT